MSRTKIKICGIFRQCDAEYVNCAVPDYAGFVFYEKSHRNVTVGQARMLRKSICGEITTVGVFVDAKKEMIQKLCRENIIGVVQLHGIENDEYISSLRMMIPDTPIWKAFKISSQEDLESAARSTADMILLDNGCGTGKTFDWSLLKDFPRPFVLAGGITPDNLTEAVLNLCPFAVDMSSGVETGGVKDRIKIVSAVTALRKSKLKDSIIYN